MGLAKTIKTVCYLGKRGQASAQRRLSESLRLADGAERQGVLVRFRGDAEIDDYYDEAGVWAGLSGELGDGSYMEYRRL